MTTTRKTLALLGTALALATGTVTTATAAGSESSPEQAVDQLRQAFNKAFSANDMAAVSALATEDAVWMPPGEPEIKGRDTVHKRYAALFEKVASTMELKAETIMVQGDLAVLSGPFTRTDKPKGGGAATVVTGKYLLVLRRQADGAWLIARDIWNEDKPTR
jgi:uncharacterized protein (TIGR02246 family)